MKTEIIHVHQPFVPKELKITFESQEENNGDCISFSTFIGKNMKPTLYLLRGLPGAGKSTLASQLCLLPNTYKCEADAYFTDVDGNYMFLPQQLHLAHKYCQSRARYILVQGWNAVVSNTSTTEKEVQTYKDIAEVCGANFVSLIVETRHEGKNVHGVPEEKLQQMKERFSIKL